MDAVMLKQIFALTFSFLLTYYLVPIFSSVAVRLKLIDVPDGKIKCHKQPTPYLGGVAVYCGFLAALALTFPFENRMFLLQMIY